MILYQKFLFFDSRRLRDDRALIVQYLIGSTKKIAFKSVRGLVLYLLFLLFDKKPRPIASAINSGFLVPKMNQRRTQWIVSTLYSVKIHYYVVVFIVNYLNFDQVETFSPSANKPYMIVGTVISNTVKYRSAKPSTFMRTGSWTR